MHLYKSTIRTAVLKTGYYSTFVKPAIVMRIYRDFWRSKSSTVSAQDSFINPHHESTSAGNQFDLPLELLIVILQYLPSQSLVRCRAVSANMQQPVYELTTNWAGQISKRLRAVIDETPELQYKIELWAAGYRDNPQCTLSVTERLKILKNAQQTWKNAAFLKGARTRIPVDGLHAMNAKKYYGNMFVGCSRTRYLDNSRLWDTIRCMALEPVTNRYAGTERKDIHISSWVMHLEHVTETFAVDVEQKLVALLNYKKNISVSQEWFYE
jgi:hypothetical protein